jgi:hypothetical protein
MTMSGAVSVTVATAAWPTMMELGAKVTASDVVSGTTEARRRRLFLPRRQLTK